MELVYVAKDAPSDGCIAVIVNNPVVSGELGEAELEEFIDDLEGRKPASAALWLKEYLPKVKAIYCFQVIHHGAEWGPGWDAIHAVQDEIWTTLGGNIQADYEGFSNEDGHHILWQFSDRVTGAWKMAVLDKIGKWVAFEMNLGNQKHRKAFWEGKVPKGIKVL